MMKSGQSRHFVEPKSVPSVDKHDTGLQSSQLVWELSSDGKQQRERQDRREAMNDGEVA
jgi:hypothetical protein